MSDTNISIDEASDKLAHSTEQIKAALKAVFNNEGKITFSQEDIEKLQVYLSEKDNKPTISTEKISINRTTSQAKNKTIGSVKVEGRKVRGRRGLSATSTTTNATVATATNETPATTTTAPVPPPKEKTIDEGKVKETYEKRDKQIKQMETLFNEDTKPAEEVAVVDKEEKAPVKDVKPKVTETKDVNKTNGDANSKTKDSNKTITISASHRKRKKSRKGAETATKQKFVVPVEPHEKIIRIPQKIEIRKLANLLSEKIENVFRKLNEYQDDAYSLQEVDQETAAFIVEEFGHIVEKVDIDQNDLEVQVKQQIGKKLVSRPPVVTVMGHVDHGKTTLLDYIRKSKITTTESGGITQHIGAYQVETQHGKITMIDTPGHEVFSEMRARGANITDIVVLVVAIDDGVKPQTLEAIQHAKAAGVEIIVAINKCDLPDTNDEMILNQLSAEGIKTPDWGGNNTMVKISALTGENVDKLLEEILDTAEVLDLKAAVDTDAYGTVIEANTEKGIGSVITGIVSAGILRKGQYLLCDTEYGKIRMLRDENGKVIKEATPSMPVQILGFSELPGVGSEFFVANSEAKAREQAKERRHKLLQHTSADLTPEIEANSLDEMLQMQKEISEKKVLNLVIKTDVAGTCEAMIQALDKIGNDNAKFKVVLKGVGPITESDVNMAQTSKAILVGFRVNANTKARKMISVMQIKTHYNDVFYEVTDFLTDELEGLLKPLVVEEVRGIAEIKELFSISKLGKVAGCGVIEGTIDTKLPARVMRDGKVVYKTKIAELRHYKNKVDSVKVGSDCGIFLEKFADFKPGDRIEVYEEVQSSQSL